MNNVTLLGRFAREHSIRHTQGAEPMAILTNSIAVNRMKKGEADFISIKAFGKTAETINTYFSKGNLILIQGHIQTGSYENKDGAKIYTTDVIIDRFEFTGEKKKEQEAQAPPDEPSGWVPTSSEDDDLPF